MLKKSFTKRIAVVLSVILLLVTSACPVFADSWRTGNVVRGRDSGYTTIWLNNTGKDAKIKIHSYTTFLSNEGKEASTTFHITMRDINGNWVWEGDIETGSSGKTLKLGCDHSAYKICIRQNELNVHQWGWLTYADYWGIECVSNCDI